MQKPQTINEVGLFLHGGLITIDFKLWTTQALLAKKLKVSRNTINNRVTRYSAAGKLRTYYIPQLGIKLIPNVNNINDLCGS